MISYIHDQVYQNDRPGKKYEGFIHIGKGDISVSRSVTLIPSDQKTCQMDNETGEDGPKSESTRRLAFCCYKDEITYKGDDIDKHGNIKEVRIIHCLIHCRDLPSEY